MEKPAAVPPDAAVITVPGVCDAPAARAKDCGTVVTRAQFESLIAALMKGKSGTVTPEMRGNLAAQYGDMLVYAQQAEELGLDKDSDTQLLLRFARMQVLTQQLLLSVKEKEKPTSTEIEKYYKDHSAEYEGISVERIMIPLGHSEKGTDAKTLADQIRKRLAAGEDAGKLQQEAYTKLGFKIEPPETALTVRANTLPPQEQSVAKLKVGEVSPVFSDKSAMEFYKGLGKKAVPLDQVRAEIQNRVEQQKVEGAGKAIRSGHDPVLNITYFNPHATK